MDPRRFAPNRLRVYSLALTLAEQVRALGSSRRCSNSLRYQLQRCVESIVLNIAEGAGHDTPRQKAQFFRIARGSAAECVGGLDLLSGQDTRLDVSSARANASMISLMLLRLIERMEDMPTWPAEVRRPPQIHPTTTPDHTPTTPTSAQHATPSNPSSTTPSP